MTIDDPAAVVTEPLPIPRRRPETLREALRGTRASLFGIELTLLAVLAALVFGPAGLAGLVEALLACAGFVLVLSSVES